MMVGLLQETLSGEKRVALVPAQIALLQKQKHSVLAQRGAGAAAGYADAEYEAAGAKLLSRDEIFAQAELLVAVRGGTLAQERGKLRPGQVLVALLEPLSAPRTSEQLAKSGATLFALDLVPRISRAQSMDALSSMANLAGYKAVLLAASHAPRVLPMMTTAAGTLAPAKVLVLGVGVAGLQAIATAKRLGAAVEAYDIRPEVAEQVKSVGGKFVDLGLAVQDASDKGGYAKAQTAEFIARQQEALAQFVRAADVVITTAQVPGRRAPILVTAAMQKGMKAGSIIVDLAGESGGNCELTQPGETIVVEGVTMFAPANLVSEVAFHASQLYSRNVVNFILNLTSKEGAMKVAAEGAQEDEILRESRVAAGGAVTHPRVQRALTA